MHTVFLVTSSSWIGAAFTGGLLMTLMVIVLFALAGGVIAVYSATSNIRGRRDAYRYEDTRLLVDLEWYQIYESKPPHGAAPPVQPRRASLDAAQNSGIYSLAVLLAIQLQPVQSLPVLILFVGLLLLLLAWLGVKVRKHSRPRQRTFDDYLDELRRDSGRYLGRVGRFFRNR